MLGQADLRVVAIEVTQGIQDLENRMPLIAHRKTWVRVHVAVQGTSGPVSFIDGALRLSKAGQQTAITQSMNGPITWVSESDRTDFNSALNFELDDHWLTGDLTIEAAVYSGTPGDIANEPIASNNTKTASVSFQQTLQPELILVPLHDGDGPGPDHTVQSMLDASAVVLTDLLTFHPASAPELLIYPSQIGPDYFYNPGGPSGALAFESDGVGSTWDLSTRPGRAQPNLAMKHMESVLGLGDAIGGYQLMGIFDDSVPSGAAGTANNGVSWTMPIFGTPAHEFGHDLGFSHVGCLDSNGDGEPDEVAGGAIATRHPTAFPNCSLAPPNPEGYFGFETYADLPEIYSNDADHIMAAFPFMSYSDPAWTDAYYYCRLIDKYGGECSPADIGVPPLSPPDTTRVSCDNPTEELCLTGEIPWSDDDEVIPGTDQLGLLVPDTTPEWVVVSAQFSVTNLLADATFALADRVPGDRAGAELSEYVDQILDGEATPVVFVQVRDARGQVVAVVPGLAHDLRPEGDGSELGGTFALAVPWPADAATVELVVSGQVLTSEALSTNPPTVAAVATTFTDNRLDVSWDSSDLDGDELRHDVLWSADGGETWYPIAQSVPGNEAAVSDNSLLPGGEVVVVKVIARDGLQSGSAVSPSFVVADRSPIAMIVQSTEGTSIPHTQVVELHALAQDPEDGLLNGDSVAWTSDLDGPLGFGRRISRSDLSVGEHVVTVEATDSGGQTTRHSVLISVTANERPKVIGDPSADLVAALDGTLVSASPDPGQPEPASASTPAAAPTTQSTTFPLAPIAAMVVIPVAMATAAMLLRRKTS